MSMLPANWMCHEHLGGFNEILQNPELVIDTSDLTPDLAAHHLMLKLEAVGCSQCLTGAFPSSQMHYRRLIFNSVRNSESSVNRDTCQ